MATITKSCTTSSSKGCDNEQTIPLGVTRVDSATEVNNDPSQRILPDLRDLVTAPRTAFENEGDLEFQICRLHPSQQEIRQGLQYALHELKTLLQRIKRSSAAREAVQTTLNDLQNQEAGLLNRGPKGMLSDIARFVEARWYLAKNAAYGRVSKDVLTGLRLWEPVYVRRV